MNNFKKKEKGITLIALVITIIVLLILAGVAISMLAGDNGILRQAAKAKSDTEDGERNDLEALDSYESVINEKTGNTPTVTEPPITAVSVNTKYQDGDKVAVIPRKFKVSGIIEEQKIDNGLVIIAPDESQFVWVPVDDINTMYETQTVTQIDGTKKEIKVGKLYESVNDLISWKENDGAREPSILKSTELGDAVPESKYSDKGIGLLKNIVKLEGETDNEILAKWEKQLQDEFDEMIKSVEKNKGFYIARYENSLKEQNGEKIIQSVKEKQTATAAKNSCNTWYGLYQKNKEYSKKNILTNIVGSSMIWESQYDQMIKWMNNVNPGVATGKIGDNRNKGTGTSVGTTGTADKDVINNVYDLYGNAYEWTLGAYGTFKRLARRRKFQSRCNALCLQSN
ncbi:MAG: hypothetical protein HFJ17_05420 [Clostridia bacterium]|nr:hypothetical protein [Clostridia bacterium]